MGRKRFIASEREREKNGLELSGKGVFQNASPIAIFKSRVGIIWWKTCVGNLSAEALQTAKKRPRVSLEADGFSG